MEAPQFKYLAEIPQHELGGGKIVGHHTVNLTAPGENFWSAMLKLDLEVDVDGRKEIVHSVAKCLPAFTKPFGRNMSIHAMNIEIGVYNNVIPVFKEFQRENGLLEANFFAKKYLAKSVEETASSRESVLILENLIVEGYNNEDRYIGFDLETAKAIVRRLAIFHATLIGLKLQKPHVFEEKVKPYTKRPPPPPGIGPPNGVKDGPPERTKNHPEGLKGGPPGGPEDGPPGFPKLMENEFFKGAVLSDPQTAKHVDTLTEMGKMNPFDDEDKAPEPWSTLVHSDCWVNNIMVKHVKGEEPQVKFVDFQMCQYRPFVADLLFFLFSSVQNHIQLENYDEILRHYHRHFTQTLKDLKVGISLTYDEFLDFMRKEGKKEVNHALMFTNILFGKKGGDKDLMNSEDFDPMEHFQESHKLPLSEEQKDKIVNIIKLAEKLKLL